MNPDPASLANLRDIALPPPVAWWPPAAGWWILGAGMLAFVLLGCVRATQARRASAYRRQALAELAVLERAPPPAAAVGLATLLKRTALAAWPRGEVSRLTGADWFGFLDRTAEGCGFSDGPGAALARATLDGERPLTPEEARMLFALSRRWIRRHQARKPAS
jgi:hypothetical protein